MTDITMIRAAQARLEGHARRTPLLTSPFLDEIAGRRVLVKPECLQHTGSFKYRGARSALSALDPDVRARGVIAFSSGNHAQGVALAAREFGVPAVIIMPSDAPRTKIDNTGALGAEVVLYDRAGEDRDAIGDRLSAERGLTLIKPFDEPQVIAGQGTTGLEIAEEAAALGIETADVLVCCGGGGLTSGIALALEADAPGLRARPVEPEGFDDVARSLRHGRIERNATSAGLGRDDGVAFQRLKVVAEPGGAVALAAALFHADETEGDTVICTISGGNVDADVFTTALTRFG